MVTCRDKAADVRVGSGKRHRDALSGSGIEARDFAAVEDPLARGTDAGHELERHDDAIEDEVDVDDRRRTERGGIVRNAQSTGGQQLTDGGVRYGEDDGFGLDDITVAPYTDDDAVTKLERVDRRRRADDRASLFQRARRVLGMEAAQRYA